MGNLFDGVQNSAFDVVTNTMGYDATWTPSDSSPVKEGRVLYNDPSTLFKLGKVNYEPNEHVAEFRAPFFDGLKEKTEKSVTNESFSITINSVVTNFIVTKVTQKYDGNTFIAILVLE